MCKTPVQNASSQLMWLPCHRSCCEWSGDRVAMCETGSARSSAREMWRTGLRLLNSVAKVVIPTSPPSREPYLHTQTLLPAAGVTNDVRNASDIHWRASLVNQYEHGLLERSE